MNLAASKIHDRTPLLNAQKHIRLLHLHGGHPDEKVSCSLTTWVLQTAPDFFAISYTWGDPAARGEVWIDGVQCIVRENSRYALWQARLHYPDCYIWIDAICINQDDLSEKGAQVSAMGEIYSKAQTVLISLGPHDVSSDFLYNTLGRLTAANVLGDFDKPIAQKWIQHQSRTWRQHTIDHWNIFCRRPYFHRLWVCQEIHESNGNALALCGKDSCRWTALAGLHHLAYSCKAPPRETDELDWTISRLQEIVRSRKPPLWDLMLLLSVSDLDCFDARDRVYGTLRLVDWYTSTGQYDCPIEADYTCDEVEISKRLMDVIAPSRRTLYTLEKIMEALNIHWPRPRLGPRLPIATATYIFRVWAAWRIFEDENHNLCARIPTKPSTASPRQSGFHPLDANESYGFGDVNVLKVLSGDQPCAIVRDQVLAGDIIVAEPSINLVLRHRSNTAFEVISQAILVKGYGYEGLWEQGGSCVCTRNDGVPNIAEILLEIDLSHADAMMLAITDRPGPQAYYERFCSDSGMGREARDVSAIAGTSLVGHLMKHLL